MYKKYTHSEFHPIMMLGHISSNIIFTEHNQSPRNYYNFSQTRQAMGIYVTNYRHRADISYVLFHPQVPLVTSRGAKYTGTINLPAGENAMVAIATYTGYNQEDSLVMNKSSIDRGLYRSMSLKKYEDVSKKSSQSTTEDEFGIKDRSLVKGLNEKDKNYDKINRYHDGDNSSAINLCCDYSVSCDVIMELLFSSSNTYFKAYHFLASFGY